MGDDQQSRKIVIFLPGLLPGGAERVMFRVAEAMSSRGHNMAIVIAERSEDLISLLPHGVDYHKLGCRNLKSAIQPFAAYLKEHQPDVVLSAMTVANCIAALAIRISRIPIRHVMSERNLYSAQTWPDRFNHFLIPTMTRLLYPRADAITAVSSEVGEDLVKHTGIPSHSVTTIPNPMPEVPSPSATAPHPWLEEDIPIFLAIASLSKQKDYPTLLRAFEMLLRNQPARLLILGKGREEQALQTLAKELDITEHISFEGYRFDRHDYLSRTDFFVLSSTYEGMPNSLLEAMAHNLPVISTKCPGGPMEALQDGRYGLICDVGSPESMAAAMAQALNNPEKARGQANLERFQADSIFDAYEQALLG